MRPLYICAFAVMAVVAEASASANNPFLRPSPAVKAEVTPPIAQPAAPPAAVPVQRVNTKRRDFQPRRAQNNSWPAPPAVIAGPLAPPAPGVFVPAVTPVVYAEPVMNMAPIKADAVADLLASGGAFIGCVGETPSFKDRDGKRIYFSSKDLHESFAVRRFERCG